MDSAPRFTARRLREGYDPAEVDAFIARVQTAIAQSPPAVSTDDLLDARFAVLEHEASYDIDQVHAWLDSMLGYLRTRQRDDGGWRTGAPASGPDADLPPELRDARPTPPRVSEPGAPAWARMTALILVISLVSFFVVSAFL